MFNQKTLSIIDAINVPVIAADENGTVIAGNKAASMFFNKKISSGTGITEFLPAVVFAGNNDLLSLKDNETFYFFEVKVPVDDKTKEADVDVTLLMDRDKRIYICTIKDISIYSNLMKSINRFSTIVETSTASVVITDAEGKIEFLNSNFQQLTGFEYTELSGRNINMLRSPLQTEEARSSLSAALKSGEKWKGELLNVNKSGEQYWVLATVSPIFGKNSEIINYISIQEDITYLKKIEEELKQSEEKFRILFETLPEGIAVLDLSGMIIQLNHAYMNIHGYGRREFIVGKNIYDVTEEKMSVLLRSLFDQAEKNGYSEVLNYEINNKDKIYIELRTALMTGINGPIGFVILEADYTGRRNAEAALRESEARNRALIEAVPDIMFRVNNKGVYLDKMLGNKISEVFPESIAVDIVSYISEAIRSREIQIFEYPVITSGGNEYYESRFIAIEDDEVLIILRNVTERHVAMRQIEESRSEAELANRSKSEFLANMSHEIRTPLNSITGFIELLTRTALDAIQKEYLEIIRNSASNLLGIINDILDFSKIESRMLELSKIEFNPYTEFESIIRLFNVKAGEKRIRLYSFIDPRIPERIISDPLRIKQVLSNLLSNAIKFTPEDGVVIIEINLSRNKDGFCLINFSVTDTGIGIPEQKQKQIFEAFTQADSSITRRFGGTGLGLSISSNLVRLLGSEIVVESTMGVGSKFYFTIEFEVSINSSPADIIKRSIASSCIVAGSREDYSFKYLEVYLTACGCGVEVRSDLSSAADTGCDIVFLINPSRGMKNPDSEDIAGLNKPLVVISDGGGTENPSHDEKTGLYSLLSHPITPEILIRTLTGIKGLKKPVASTQNVNEKAVNLKFSGKVLVGEDNTVNQKLMMLLLKDYGLEVDLAGNGLKVIEKFKNDKYDLLFMDINMPASDGIETTHAIRDYESEKKIPATPIVALTAKALKGDREIFIESGMDDYLAKPLEMVKLETVLMKYLPLSVFEKSTDDDENTYDGSAAPRYFDLKKTAAELKIPVNVLLNIGRDFFEDTLKVIDEIKPAVGNLSYKRISELSHKVKGASANLRFVKLSGFFSLLEEKSLQRDENFDYYGLIDNIINEIYQLRNIF